MRVQWGLCEKEKVQGVLVHHRDDVDQGGDVGPCFFSIDGEELEPYDRKRGVWSVWPRVVSRSARGAVGRSERLRVWLIPSGPVWGEVGGWLSGSGRIGLGRGWGGEPGGECENGNGAPLRGSRRIRYDGSLTQPRLGRLFGSGGAAFQG